MKMEQVLEEPWHPVAPHKEGLRGAVSPDLPWKMLTKPKGGLSRAAARVEAWGWWRTRDAIKARGRVSARTLSRREVDARVMQGGLEAIARRLFWHKTEVRAIVCRTRLRVCRLLPRRGP